MNLDDLRARDDWPRLEAWLHKSRYKRLCERTGMTAAEARAARLQWRADGGPSRHGKAGSAPAASIAPGPAKGSQREEVQTGLDERDRYVFNRDTGTYVFSLPGISRDIVLARAVVDGMVRDYSGAVDKAATVNEVARTHGLPRRVVMAVLRALGVTHDALPWTEERLAEASDEELVKEAAELRKLGVYRKIERDKWRAVEEDAQRWRKLEASLWRPLREAIREHAPRYAPPALRLSGARRPWALVVGLTDEHWGMRATGYGPAEHRERYLARIEELLGQVSHLGRAEAVYVPIGSDGLHVDTAAGTTTKGTPQSLAVAPAEAAWSWLRYKVEQLDALRAMGPLRLVPLPGNHDQLSSVLAAVAVSAWYEGAGDVHVVDGAPGDTIRAEVFGDTLLAWHHGDRHKVRDLAEIIPRRYSASWGATKHRYVFTGHYHVERDLPTRAGLRILRQPSAIEPDAWTRGEGYSDSGGPLVGHVIMRAGGLRLRVEV